MLEVRRRMPGLAPSASWSTYGTAERRGKGPQGLAQLAQAHHPMRSLSVSCPSAPSAVGLKVQAYKGVDGGAGTVDGATVGKLHVKLHRAQGLPDKGLFGLHAVKMDPYVIVEYQVILSGKIHSRYRQKSNVARGQGSNPKWDQTIDFDVKWVTGSNLKHKLALKIMDDNIGRPDGFVGEVEMIDVTDLISPCLKEYKDDEWLSREHDVKNNDEHCGKISVGISFRIRGGGDSGKHILRPRR